MEFLFKHFGKLWLVMFLGSIVVSLSILGVLGWAIVKVVNHLTGTPM